MSISLEHQAPSDVRRLKKSEKNMSKEAACIGSNLSLTEFNGIFKDMQVSWFGEVFFLCLYLQNQYERELLFLH